MSWKKCTRCNTGNITTLLACYNCGSKDLIRAIGRCVETRNKNTNKVLLSTMEWIREKNVLEEEEG